MRNRTLVLAVLLVFAVGLAWAGGDKAGQKKDPAAVAAKYQAKLGLTDAQTAQVRAVLEDTHQRYAALKTQGLDEARLREEKQKLMAEQDTRLKAIFTPEQFNQYQAMKAGHKQKGKTE